MKTLIISASARDDGNSDLLARAAVDGARSAGHDVEHVFLADYVERMLDNCRRCRRVSDRLCSLDDRYGDTDRDSNGYPLSDTRCADKSWSNGNLIQPDYSLVD